MEDREAIYDHIDSESPRNAVMVDGEISAATSRLLDFAESGRIGRVRGTRELVILRTPYIAAYTVEAMLFASCASCASCMAHSNGRTSLRQPDQLPSSPAVNHLPHVDVF
jgi:toxin ParE1/3/4